MNVNYLSDDEENIEETINNDNSDIYYESENGEEEYDEEEYNKYIQEQNLIILNAIKKKALCILPEENDNKEIINKKQENKISKNMSFSNFNKQLDKIIEDIQPKKFISKRLLDKKQIIEPSNMIQIEIKRQFNPRLPPYFQINLRIKKD